MFLRTQSNKRKHSIGYSATWMLGCDRKCSYFKDFNKVLVNFPILMDKGAKGKLAGSPGENGGGWDAQKDLHSRTGRDKTKRKTQERMERRSRKRS